MVRPDDMGARCVFVALLTWIAWPLPLHAQRTPDVTVEWDAPADCAAPGNFLAEVARLVGPEWSKQGTIEFEVQLEQESSTRWWLRLEVDGNRAEGERELVMRSCDDVRQAAVLLAALALDPEATSDAIALPPEPEPAASGDVPQRGVAPFVLVTMDALALPTPAFGPALGVGLFDERWRVDVGALLLLPTRGDAQASAEIGLASGSLDLAYLVGGAPFALGPIARLEIGWMFASAPALPRATSGGSIWSAGFAGLQAELTLGWHVGLRLELLGGLPFVRPRFALHDGETLHTPRPATARASAGGVLRF